MNENVPAASVSFSAASRTLTRYWIAPEPGSAEFGALSGTGTETTSDDSVNWMQLVPQLDWGGAMSVMALPFNTRRTTSVSPLASADDNWTRTVGRGSLVVPPAAMLLSAGMAPKTVENGITSLVALIVKVWAGRMLSTVNA